MRLTVLMGADVTGGHFSLCALHAPPGAATAVHRHDHEDEIVAVQRGALRVWEHGETRELGPGDTMLLRKGLPHQLVCPAAAEPTDFLLAIVPGGFETAMAAASTPAAQPALDLDDVAALFAGAGVSVLAWEPEAPKVAEGPQAPPKR